MRRHIQIRVLALMVMPVLAAIVVGGCAPPDAKQPQATSSGAIADTNAPSPATRVLSRPAPARPAPGPGPIGGDKVSVDEARRRTPYTIPMPVETITSAQLVEVWASSENTPRQYRQVYRIYSNGLRISIGGRPEQIDYSALASPPFRATKVNGIPASGKDPLVKELEIGGRVNTPANLSWWVNGVDIGLYHPAFSMDQLVKVAESMPTPTWK